MTDTTNVAGLQFSPPRCPRCGQPLKDCPDCGQPVPQPDPWPYPYYVGDLPYWWQQGYTITCGPNIC